MATIRNMLLVCGGNMGAGNANASAGKLLSGFERIKAVGGNVPLAAQSAFVPDRVRKTETAFSAGRGRNSPIQFGFSGSHGFLKSALSNLAEETEGPPAWDFMRAGAIVRKTDEARGALLAWGSDVMGLGTARGLDADGNLTAPQAGGGARNPPGGPGLMADGVRMRGLETALSELRGDWTAGVDAETGFGGGSADVAPWTRDGHLRRVLESLSAATEEIRDGMNGNWKGRRTPQASGGAMVPDFVALSALPELENALPVGEAGTRPRSADWPIAASSNQWPFTAEKWKSNGLGTAIAVPGLPGGMAALRKAVSDAEEYWNSHGAGTRTPGGLTVSDFSGGAESCSFGRLGIFPATESPWDAVQGLRGDFYGPAKADGMDLSGFTGGGMGGASLWAGGDILSLSSDDRRAMRDLTDTGQTRTFVALSPTVTVTTGDIRNDVDVNGIVSKIERALSVEIAASSAAVLGVG